MISKRRVTYVLHSIAVGGVEMALLSAIPALNRQYDLNVIVLGTINPEIISHLTDEEKKVFKQLDYPVILYPAVLPKIIRTVLNTRPDILICSLWRSSLIGTLTKLVDKKIKLYAFIHSTDFPHGFAKEFNKLAVRTADYVLVDSSATKSYVASEFKPRADIKVVSFLTRSTPALYNTVAPEVNADVHFMFLGRINKVKNIPAAIELIRYLHENNVKAYYDIYGRDDDGTEANLRDLVAKHNLGEFIKFRGEVTGAKKWDVFSAYHFYLQLSFNEGMAMSVTEAMQSGVVCIVSPVGEIVNYSSDMESAIFISVLDPKNSEEDFRKVLNVIRDSELYNKLSSNCHNYFASKPLYADSLIEHIEATHLQF